MELGKVIFSDKTNQRFEELVLVLFHKNYFSYQRNAIEYVDKIYEFINKNIHNFRINAHKITILLWRKVYFL